MKRRKFLFAQSEMKEMRNQTVLWICSSVVERFHAVRHFRQRGRYCTESCAIIFWIVSSASLSLDASFSKNNNWVFVLLGLAPLASGVKLRDAAAVVACSGFKASPFPAKEMLFSQCCTKFQKRLSVLANKHPDISWQLVPVWIGFRSSKYFPSILSQSPSFQHVGSR